MTLTPTVRVLVRDSDPACAVYNAMRWWSADWVRDPAAQGERWWSLLADVQVPPPQMLLDAVERAEAAVVVAAADDRTWHVSLVQDGGMSVLEVDRVGAAAAVEPWVRRWAPAVRRPKMRRHVLGTKPDLLEDRLALLLREAGWPLHQGFPDAKQLANFEVRQAPSGPVGETYVAWSASRWVGGLRRDGGWALWDRDNPPDPVMTWPPGEEYRDAMYAELDRRVIRPILEHTELPGPRAWTRTLELNRDPYMPSDALLLLHWSPNGHMTSFSIGNPRISSTMSPPGFVTVTEYQTEYLGIHLPPETFEAEVRLKDFATVKRVEEAGHHIYRRLEAWRDVPDTVPRDLMGTVAWIRSESGWDAGERMSGDPPFEWPEQS
jgi:hypothetical protein